MTEPKKMFKFDHHSTGDWDFDNTSWTLDTSVYISPPSSLCFPSTINKTLIKTMHVPIGSVKEGQIITYAYGFSGYTCGQFFYFRFQDTNNFYAIQHYRDGSQNLLRIVRVKAGVTTYLKSGSTAYLWGWAKYRITWWNDFVGLVIRVEVFTGGAWVKLINDGYDSENNWKDIGGRVGIGGGATYFDDTEIYGSG